MAAASFLQEMQAVGQRLLLKLQRLPQAEPVEIVAFSAIVLFTGQWAPRGGSRVPSRPSAAAAAMGWRWGPRHPRPGSSLPPPAAVLLLLLIACSCYCSGRAPARHGRKSQVRPMAPR
ncbi:Small integral membrane protein 5 [Galemys pyrenaicus]|uniref:Small integral membrane protein 5 n=1 Tax=Galemys pyrenaicus TaxID=202257 RepID=A0A8J5ZZ21_GALPY|nr:Small integral membrane protein 5 [Galemys pyrenaicus]